MGVRVSEKGLGFDLEVPGRMVPGSSPIGENHGKRKVQREAVGGPGGQGQRSNGGLQESGKDGSRQTQPAAQAIVVLFLTWAHTRLNVLGVHRGGRKASPERLSR